MNTIIEDRMTEAEEMARFQYMMSDTKRRAYSMALQLTRNPSDAEDLVQDTYVKAWRGFDGYVQGRPFLNWLLRIMQRAYLDSRRRDNPIRKAESLQTGLVRQDGEIIELPIIDDEPMPDQAMLREETRRELYVALNQLPEVYKDAIVMCDLESLSYSEIAEAQGTTVGTVRSRIHRGRRLLRDAMIRLGSEI